MRFFGDEIRALRGALPMHWTSRASPVLIFFGSYVLTVLPLAIALALFSRLQVVWGFVLLALVSGFTQNALGLLMHEGSHFFFHKNKRVNDALANVLVCYPLFNTVQGYREEHLAHHRESGNASDPYHKLYTLRSRSEVRRAFIKDVACLTAVSKFLGRYGQKPRREGRGFAGVLIMQALLAYLFFSITGVWFAYVFCWFLPLLSIPQVVNRVRTMVEHHVVEGQVDRSTVPTLFEFFFIAPYGYAYHLVHHRTANVPYYQLRWSHRFLEQKGAAFTNDEVARGYLRTFWRLYRGLPG